MSGVVGKLAGWLTAANRFRKNQSVVPATPTDDGTTISIDAAKSNNWKITLTGNRTLANPTNLKEGMIINIAVDQDTTGNRVLTYGSMWKPASGQSLTLSTVASSKDLLSGYFDGTIIRSSLGKGYA